MAPHDRRTFLGAAAGAVGAVSLGPAATTGGATSGEAATDTEVTIVVGAGGDLVFEPSTVAVTPGTTVRFVWESDNHNIVVDGQPDGADWGGSPKGSRDTYDEGYEDTHTFEVPGTYEFHCEPHQAAGATGTIEVVEPDATVTVGPGGELVFEPETLEIDPGDAVRFVWESDNHNVVVDDHPEGAEWRGTPGSEGTTYNTGYEHVHVFDVEGRYEYYCAPHRAAGMEGEILVGDVRNDEPRSGTAEVVVGPGGNLVFAPENLRITPGTTVNFVWESDNHNVVVDSKPDGADWSGTPGGENDFYDAGYEYSHTFETTGTYEYYCTPHRPAGMKGTVEVVTPDATAAPTTSHGPTDGDDGTGTASAEFADGDEDGSPLPFSGPAVVGGAALAGGALERLRRRVGGDDDAD